MIHLFAVVALLFPNPTVTPGAALTGRASDICSPGWASAHRHVTSAQRRRAWRAYGYDQPRAGWELDHLIPLEVGGSNADANLWPEPPDARLGWRAKDRVENAVHSAVCDGELTVKSAQAGFARDWARLGRRIGVPVPAGRP